MSLRIHFLGQPRIHRDGVLVNLPGLRPLALLAYLIVTQKAHRREHLIDLLFDNPADPRAALRWTLSKIRKAIGKDYLLTDREEISFNFKSKYWIDVIEFEKGELGLYQGDFLEGLYLRDALRFEDWLVFERGRLRGLYQTGLERQLGLSRRNGEVSEVVIAAQQLLKLDNLREDWHCALMEAYAWQGKRETALEQYEQCRRALQAAWSIVPAPETTALSEAIRCGEVGPPLAPFRGESNLTVGAVETRLAEPQSRLQRFRRTLSSPVVTLIGLSVLVAASLLFFGGATRLIRTAYPEGARQSVTEGSEGRTDAPVQLLADTTVWILGPFQDTHTRLFQQSMMPFEKSTGVNVVFMTAKKDYDRDLANRLESGDLPDIVIIPQPAWLETLAKQGKIVNLSTFMDDEYLKQHYPEALLDLVSINGQVFGIWHTIYLKSLVWYPKRAFEAKGYAVPDTWDELVALSNRIVADGGVPWCIGIEESNFTGWVGTDWVEDILLRTAPLETYDAWIKHELPFHSPEVRRAFEIMGQIWLNEDYVYGGTAHILKESILQSPAHLFEDPPGCYLHKQGSFTPYFFPPGASYGVDYDFFYLPPIEAEFGKPY